MPDFQRVTNVIVKHGLALTTAFGFVTWARNLGSAHACAQPAVGAGHPPRRTNHAAFFSLLMDSPRKNGRLGDPALPSLSSNSFHVKHFHPKFLEARDSGLESSKTDVSRLSLSLFSNV